MISFITSKSCRIGSVIDVVTRNAMYTMSIVEMTTRAESTPMQMFTVFEEKSLMLWNGLRIPFVVSASAREYTRVVSFSTPLAISELFRGR